MSQLNMSSELFLLLQISVLVKHTSDLYCVNLANINIAKESRSAQQITRRYLVKDICIYSVELRGDWVRVTG